MASFGVENHRPYAFRVFVSGLFAKFLLSLKGSLMPHAYSSRFLLLVASSALFGASSLSAGLKTRQGELSFQTTVSIADRGNLGARSASPGDTVFTVTPTLLFSRSEGAGQFNASLSTPFVRYDELDYLDSDDLTFSLSGELPYGSGKRLTGSWNVGYSEQVELDFFTRGNLKTDALTGSLGGDFKLNRKLSLRGSYTYQTQDSQTVVAPDEEGGSGSERRQDSINFGFHAHDLIGGMGAYVVYEITNRETTFGGNIDDKDEGINFGLNGQLLPRGLFPNLDADVRFGFKKTEQLEGRGASEDRLTLNGSLSQAWDKTNLALVFGRDLALTTDDRTVEGSHVGLNFGYRPQSKLGLSAFVRYNIDEFLDGVALEGGEQRKDTVTSLGASASYSIRSNWNASLSLSSRSSSSNDERSDFSSTDLSLSSTVSF